MTCLRCWTPLGALAVCAALTTAPQAPWPAFRHDTNRTGVSPYVGAQSGNLQWSFQTGNHICSAPAIDANGTIYIGSYDHTLYALRAPPSGTAPSCTKAKATSPMRQAARQCAMRAAKRQA